LTDLSTPADIVDPSSSSEHSQKLFCPSCGAELVKPTSVEGLIRCSVCGTETSVLEAEQTSIELESEQGTTADASLPTAVTAADAMPIDIKPVGKKLRTEDILLERLINEPKTTSTTPTWLIGAMLVAIITIASIIYFATKPEEKFAAVPLEGTGHVHNQEDSTLAQQKLAMAHVIDSIKTYIASAPTDMKARRSLANAYYLVADYPKAKENYEAYLAVNPKDPDVLVEYGYTIAQITGDPKLALEQLEKALAIQPDHLNALFNAGLLSIKITEGGHREALDNALSYFKRAKQAAKKQNPEMAPQIEAIIEAMTKKMNSVEHSEDSTSQIKS